WGVLGLATGGALFSLLTLLFSGAMILKTRLSQESFGAFQFSRCFLTHPRQQGIADLVGNGRGLRRHQFRKARIFAQGAELVVFVDVLNVLVALFHRLLQIVQRTVGLARAGVQFGENIIIVGAVFGRRKLGQNSAARGALENVWIKLHRLGIALH